MAWHSSKIKNGYLIAVRFACVAVAILFLQSFGKTVARDEPTQQLSVLIVVGASGESEYADTFRASAMRWVVACQVNDNDVTLFDGTEKSTDGESDQKKILDWIDGHTARERWIVLIGHGTSDRDANKFNLRGPDVTADELSKSLAKHNESRWLIVNCGSSSGPFINALSGQNRVVVTATKSGAEQNYARFGEFLSQTITDPESDLDHDYSISILEAFLAASNRVAMFYTNEDRLPTEQALIDDNADKKGTPAIFYRGSKAIKTPAEGLKPDGLLAARIQITTLKKSTVLTPQQQAEIEQLENQVASLYSEKKNLEETDYFQKLEALLMEIIRVREIE